jgi:hypothetical protein
MGTFPAKRQYRGIVSSQQAQCAAVRKRCASRRNDGIILSIFYQSQRLQHLWPRPVAARVERGFNQYQR